MTGITHVIVESENRDHGQALGDVNVDKREPHRRLRTMPREVMRKSEV